MAPLILGFLLAGVIAAAGPAPIAAPQLDCVKIQSPAKLSAGSTFRVAIRQGLEFRLSKTWEISVGPVGDPTDYLWLVSPPLQFAPHRRFGPGYNVATAADSARINRSLRFVLNRQDYDAAMAAINLPDAGETLKVLDELGRGVLVLYVDKYELNGDAFKWISFHGEACVPKG